MNKNKNKIKIVEKQKTKQLTWMLWRWALE